jgi:thymidylate kinase
MMTEWGLLGAAYGLLISEMLGSIARWMAFLLLVPESAGSGGDRPTIGPATRAHCRKGERLQEGLCSDATPIVTTAAAVDNWSTQSSALAEEESGAGRILLRFFELLDRAGIRYCVLHGYEDYPHRVDSDIDCVIDAAISPRQFYNLLHRERSRLGAKVVRCRGYHFVLAGRNADDSLCFVTLDLSIDCELENLTFYPGSKLLDSRRRYRQFWVSPPKVEFICYLSRTILKGSLDATRIQRLSNLFEEDAAGCEEQLGRVFDSRSADLLLCAARSGDWSPVRHCLAKLQTEVRRRALLLWPLRTLRKGLHSLLARIAAIWRPQGLDVVLLGPDGAGKSSVIDALPPMLAPVFNRSACFGLVPSLMQSLVHGRDRVQTNPHALPPRSMPVSVVRAVFYWFAYYIVAYGLRRVMMARATLVLNDRHFVDVLVDAKRYRYGGPMWLLRLIWRISPKPDLIVLLDAPPEVLQARKQELSFDETARLCAAYLSMVRSMKAGHVVDADRPFEHVARDVSALILRVLAARLARRFRCEHAFPPQTMALDAI